MIDDIPDLPPHAADLDAEAALGHPLPYTPEQGIRAMTIRIEGLLEEIRVLLEGPMGQDAEYLMQERRRIIPQLKEARQRMIEYEMQLRARN